MRYVFRYNVIGFVLSWSALNYAAVPFQLLTLGDSWAAWTNLYFVGHVGSFLFIAALSMMPKKKADRGDKPARAKEE